MTTIISKSGTGPPASDKLETAELAVDTSNGDLYTKLADGISVVQIGGGSGSGGGVEEAPIDTKQYARQDGSWSEIVIPDGGTGGLWTDEGDGSISYSGDISVGGDAAFSGDVVTKDVLGRGIYRDAANGAGLRFSNNGCIFPTDGTGTQKTAEIDLGGTQYKFKDGYFSGSVSAGSVTANTLATNRETNGYFFKAEYGSTGTFSSFNHSAGNTLEIVPLGGLLKVNGTVSAGDGKFTGTVDATAFTTGAGNGTDGRAYFEIKGRNLWSDRFGVFFGSAGLVPTDNDSNKTTGETDFGSNVNRWKNGYFAKTVFAEDHIASSDERLKDNITTAPVGLIDSLKGREWDWKESGKKGSGVVAQELEQVLPHLVHTDDDGMKSVSYMGLCAYLIEEVKALKAEVEALK